MEMGWKGVQERLLGKDTEEKSGEEDEEQRFPELTVGQKVWVRGCNVIAKKTTPPKLHTEATLLSAMEKAGGSIENGDILKGKGIGTQATRAEIIKKLFDTEYCETLKKGKVNYIVPTAKGIAIIKVLPPELYSPSITADWETKIAKIAEGEMTEKQFMDEFLVFIHEKVKEVKASDIKVTFSKEREVVGSCPWCEADLYRYEVKNEKTKKVTDVRYYCSNKEQCSFSMNLANPTVTTWTGKKLTENQLQKLTAYGFIVLTCKSKIKGGADFKGKFTIIKKEVNDKVYANLSCEPVQKRKK